MQAQGLAGLAIGTAVVVLTIMIVVILAYVFKDELLSAINLTTEAENQVDTIWGFGTVAFTILGLGVLVMAFGVAIQTLRQM